MAASNVAFRRYLRREATPAEVYLWQFLRNNRLHGLRFRRQHPIQCFILDFYCAECKLAIELDGEIHNQQLDYDQSREAYLSTRGIQVLRYQNKVVLEDVQGVLTDILQHANPQFKDLLP